jgi:serine/threonine protein kinase
LEGCSLAEVLRVNPVWWTSTVKAKAVTGIVLGLRYAHSLGLIHGHLTASNILFDSEHCIQIVDFDPIFLEARESESENEEATQLVGFSEKE